jgi:hypothetical protein
MNKLNLYNIGDSNETYIALLSCIKRVPRIELVCHKEDVLTYIQVSFVCNIGDIDYYGTLQMYENILKIKIYTDNDIFDADVMLEYDEEIYNETKSIEVINLYREYINNKIKILC